MTYSNFSMFITSKRTNKIYEFKVITRGNITELYSVDSCTVVNLFGETIDDTTINLIAESCVCMYEVGVEMATKSMQHKLCSLLGLI